MTVAQLIEALQAMPQDLPVYLGDWNEGYAADIPIDHDPGALPRVVDARVDPRKRKWNHPQRVVIG
jgi:hypothetical protein